MGLMGSLWTRHVHEDGRLPEVPTVPEKIHPEAERRTEGLSAAEVVEAAHVRDLTEAAQVREITGQIERIDGFKYENWEHLSLNERLETLQEAENRMAEAQGRQAMTVELKRMPSNQHGYMSWSEGKIVLNQELVSANGMESLQNSVRTLVHEGRHAYQYHNVYVERTEPNSEKFLSWRENLCGSGYMDAQRYGFRMYYIQPVEVDARVFAESVVSQVSYR